MRLHEFATFATEHSSQLQFEKAQKGNWRLTNALYEEASAFLPSIASGKDTEKGNNWMMLYEPHFFLSLS